MSEANVVLLVINHCTWIESVERVLTGLPWINRITQTAQCLRVG